MKDQQRRRAANVLIGLGAGLVLLVAGYWGYGQLSARQLRATLRSAPVAAAAPAEIATAAPSPTNVAVATATPAPTTRAASAAGEGGQGAAAVATVARTATMRPALAPTRTPTRVRPTATPRKPTATPTAAAVAPARLAIADLKIDAKVVPMGWQVVETAQGPRSEWVIPENDAGHHINSAYLGDAGNLVISGHNNIYARIFLRISQAWDNASRVKVDDFTDRSDLLDGRTIQLFDAAGKRYDYVITDFLRVRDTGVSQQQRINNGRFLLPTNTAQLTIITCWPPTNNTHRLVVIAEPAP